MDSNNSNARLRRSLARDGLTERLLNLLPSGANVANPSSPATVFRNFPVLVFFVVGEDVIRITLMQHASGMLLAAGLDGGNSLICSLWEQMLRIRPPLSEFPIPSGVDFFFL